MKTNLEKLIHMREAADQSLTLPGQLRELGLTDEQIEGTIAGYQEGMSLFDQAVEAYALMLKLGRFEQMRRDGRSMGAEERSELANLQRKVDDFAVKIFKAG